MHAANATHFLESSSGQSKVIKLKPLATKFYWGNKTCIESQGHNPQGQNIQSIFTC